MGKLHRNSILIKFTGKEVKREHWALVSLLSLSLPTGSTVGEAAGSRSRAGAEGREPVLYHETSS